MSGILTLDPGSRITGWAWSEPGAPKPEWGRFVMRQGEETAKHNSGEIGVRFEIFLEARIDVFKPDYIVREQPYIPQPRKPGRDREEKNIPVNYETLFPLLGLAWQIDTIASRRGIECQEASTYAAVKHFTGKAKYPGATPAARRAAKKRATVAMCKLHGWPCSEDEADALALLCYAESVLFPYQRQLKPTGPLFSQSHDRQGSNVSL